MTTMTDTDQHDLETQYSNTLALIQTGLHLEAFKRAVLSYGNP